MKEYEQRIIRAMNSTRDDVLYLCDVAYQEGYEARKAEESKSARAIVDMEQQKSYEDGLNDAWEAAKKLVHPRLGGYTEEQKQRIFGEYVSSDSILQNFTAPEAIAKIKAYADKQSNHKEIMDFCETMGYSLDELAEVLAEMRGAENDE